METEETHLKILMRGAVFVFAGLVISKILGYAYRLIIARLGASEYGQFSIGLAIVSIITTLCLFGFPQMLIRYVAYYKSRQELDKLNETISFSLKFTFLISVVLAGILFLLSDWIALKVFHSPGLNTVIKILAISIPFDVVRNNIWGAIKALQKIEYEVYSRHLAENITKVALTVIFLYAGLRLFGAAAAFFGAIFVSFIFSAYFMHKILPIDFNAPRTGIRRELLTYSAPLLLNNAIIPVLAWADTLMLGYFKSAFDVGIYNAAVPTAQLMYFFPSMLLPLFMPVLTGLYAKQDSSMLATIYSTITKWIFMVNLALLAVITALSKQFLGFLFGSEYVSGATALLLLAIGYFVYHLSLTCNALLLTVKRPKLTFFVFLAGSAINIPLNLLLIPSYGLFGAALATSTSLILMGCANIFFAKRITGLRQFTPTYLKIIFSAAVSFLVLQFTISALHGLPNTLLFAVSASLQLISYTLLLFFTKSITKTDVFILREMQRKTGIRIPLLQGFVKRFVK